MKSLGEWIAFWRRQKLVLTIFALSLLPAVGAAVFVLWGIHVQTRAREGWAGMGLSDEAVAEKYPPEEVNASALELERLAAKVGLRLAPKRALGRAEPEAAAAREWEEVKGDLGQWLLEQCARSTRGIDSPPEEGRRFMSRHSSQIAALREHLIEADPPRWKSDLSALVSAPIPNLLGQMDLQRLLVGDALERYRRGNERDALRDLEAAWRHGEVLRQRPILVTRLNGWYAARLQLCGLRQICPGEEYYLRRVRQLRPRESLREGQALDVWLIFSPDHMQKLTVPRSGHPWWDWSAAFPYRVSMADMNLRLQDWLVEQFDHPCPCGTEPGSDQEGPGLDLAWWNTYGLRIAAIMDYRSPVARGARLALDADLTAEWLKAVQAFRRGGESGDSPPARSSPSEACPGLFWRVRETEEGALRLELSESEPLWPKMGGAPVPQLYEGRVPLR